MRRNYQDFIERLIAAGYEEDWMFMPLAADIFRYYSPDQFDRLFDILTTIKDDETIRVKGISEYTD